MRFSALSLALHHHTCLPCQRWGAVARKNSGDYRRDCHSTNPSQNRTITLAFRNANICMHQYVFTSALSHENRQHPCLPSKKGRWHGWYKFFACCTVFRYSCLYNSETIPSRDGGDCECVEAFTVALPSFQSLTPCTNPPKTALYHPLFVMPTSVCADTLSNSHYPIRFS